MAGDQDNLVRKVKKKKNDDETNDIDSMVFFTRNNKICDSSTGDQQRFYTSSDIDGRDIVWHTISDQMREQEVQKVNLL